MLIGRAVNYEYINRNIGIVDCKNLYDTFNVLRNIFFQKTGINFSLFFFVARKMF